jgi:ribose 5-phosphate isomerase
VDDSKLSGRLGERKSVQVEVVQFGWRRQAEHLRALGGIVTLQLQPASMPFVTDQGSLSWTVRSDPLRIRRRSR